MNAQTIETLKQMSREQLVDTAKQQGLKVHHKAKPETILKQIVENMTPNTQKPQGQAEKPKPEAIEPHSEEAVRQAVSKFEAKGLEVKFPGDGTWHFKCRGAEDSGHLAIPMRVIVMKAGTVAQGARRLRTHSNQDFDAIPTNPNSRYAASVLA